MAPESQLFDPAQYSDKMKRRVGRPASGEQVPEVIAERGWYPIARNRRGVAPFIHRLMSMPSRLGAVTTECGITGRALDEVEVGREAFLCPRCGEAIEANQRALRREAR